MRFARARITVALVMSMASTTIGCGTNRSGTGDLAPQPSATGSRIITSEMIAKWNVLDAYAAIERAGGYRLSDNSRGGVTVRQRRGQSSLTSGSADRPVLIIDGAQMSDFAMLHQIRTQEIDRIELVSPSDATQRFGTTSSGAGAIIVVTRSRR